MPDLGSNARVRAARNPPRGALVVIGVIAVTSMIALGIWVSSPSTYAADAEVPLGTAETYAVLGGSTVTNVGATALIGDLGVSPGTAITGFPLGTVSGTTHAGDTAAAQAHTDLGIAFNAAAGLASTGSLPAAVTGLTFTPGVYTAPAAVGINGPLILDGQGDPDALFVFQIGSTLDTAASTNVSLINGAQACHVYWQVGSSATLGATSFFKGTILALTAITVGAGVDIEGRALALNAAVTLDTDAITVPTCLVPPTTTTEVPTTTTTEVPTTTTTTTEPPTTTTTTTEPPTTTTTTTEPPTTTTTTTEPPTTTTTGTSTTTTTTGLITTPPAVGSIGVGGATPGGGAPSTDPSSETSVLAFTGTGPALIPLLAIGALLLMLGALLVTRSHRRTG